MCLFIYAVMIMMIVMIVLLVTVICFLHSPSVITMVSKKKKEINAEFASRAP